MYVLAGLLLSLSNPATAQITQQSPQVLRESCDTFTDVAVAKDNSVYAMAYCQKGVSWVNRLFKYSASGARLWKIEAGEYGQRMFLDDNDNVIFTNVIAPNGNDTVMSATVTKVSAAGVVQWSKAILSANTSTAGRDRFQFKAGAAVGSDIYLGAVHFVSDSIFLTTAATFVSIHYLKLNASGDLVWQQDEAPISAANPSSSAECRLIPSLPDGRPGSARP